MSLDLARVACGLACVVVVAVVAGGCGDDDTTSAQTADNDVAALASVTLVEDAVDVREGSATEYASVSAPVPAAAGDAVRTDGSGFAEITYFDGSVARLDVNTELELTGLVDNPTGSVVRTKMGVGRTWHRVQPMMDNDLFEVETPTATAVARGTAFVIDCAVESCTFAVLEGTVDLLLADGTMAELNVVSVEAGQSVLVSLDGQPEPSIPISGDLFADAWLSRNNDLDQAAGMDDLLSSVTG